MRADPIYTATELRLCDPRFLSSTYQGKLETGFKCIDSRTGHWLTLFFKNNSHLVTYISIDALCEYVQVQGEQNQILAANQASALREQHSKSASAYQDAFAAMAATMGADDAAYAVGAAAGEENASSPGPPPAALAAQLMVPFSPASSAGNAESKAIDKHSDDNNDPKAANIFVVDTLDTNTQVVEASDISVPPHGVAGTIPQMAAGSVVAPGTPKLNDSLADFEALEAAAATPAATPAAAAAAAPKFMSRLARPQSKLSSFTASPLRSAVVPVVRKSLAVHAVERHSRLQSQTAAAASEGHLISFDSPSPTAAAPETPTEGEAKPELAEGMLINFDSPAPTKRSVRFAGVARASTPTSGSAAAGQTKGTVRPSLLAMLEKADKSKVSDAATRQPLQAVNAAAANVATDANAADVKATSRAPSIWSPVSHHP